MAGTTDPDEPIRSVEIELTFDVDDAAPLPEWEGVPGIARVEEAPRRDLDARYFDSTGLELARAGVAVRRRTGGPDAGWHLKGPREGLARVELGWPLGPDDDVVPSAVRSAVAAVTEAPLQLIARILNTRTPYLLLDEEGGIVAEFVDDRVVATDERSGTVRRWREWEVELGPAASTDADARAALFAAAGSAISAVGGVPAASASKLARALGE
ncbi:CYTH domain-containing protein [Microbacterium sp. NPDC055910]|uniref:CYTH domain-containing protein n=1 Tax=Microbacterium sp. NPDC055910 TaxID=3345659 RepID=UPI0035DA86A0